MSLVVRVPDGRIIRVPTDDQEEAKQIALNYAKNNPRIQGKECH